MRALIFIFLLSVWGGGSLLANPVPATSAIPKKILLLYSNGYGATGVEIFSEGFRSAMRQGGFNINDVFFEYLDLGRNRELNGYRGHLRDLLFEKYARRNVRLIVTLEKPALDFLLREGGNIAPTAPVITLGAPMPTADMAQSRQIVSGVTRFDIKGTLEHALNLFPQTERIMFVSGSSEADKRIAADADEAAAPWRGKLEFESSGELPVDQLLQKAAHLPARSLIIFGSYNQDSSGRTTISYDVEGLLVKAANAPVFGLLDFNLANGGIGGSVVSVKSGGAAVGQAALSILDAKLQLSEPLSSVETHTVPMFDWDQIERWGGNASGLPKDTVFVNRTSTFWEGHKNLILALTAVFLAQLLTIIGLAINRRRRLASEKLLIQSEDSCRLRLDGALEHKRQYEEGLELLLILNQQASGMTEMQICDRALDIAVKTTKSSIGYLHYVNDDQVTFSMSTWNAEARKHCTAACASHYPFEAAGIWADSARMRGPVIHNNYQNMPGKRGYPEGHAHLIRHMSVPVLDQDSVRMIIGVGNKGSDYVDEDSGQLQFIASEAQKIIQRRRTEDALHESEARFRFITDLSPSLIWVADTSKLWIWFNKTWLDFSGRPMEQELGNGWTEGVHPEDFDACVATYVTNFDARTPFTMEYRLKRHDGEYRWLLDIGQPRVDENGAFKGYVGSCLDITERKRIEVERESFHTLFTLSLDMMCIVGADGYFKKVNPAFSKVLGYSAAEFLERPFIDFVIPEDRQATLNRMESQLQAGAQLDFENRYWSKDGPILLLSWHVFMDQDNQVMYATVRDVTDQRAGEEQLHKLYLAVEQTSHSIVITDLQPSVEYVNQAFSKISGYSAEEVLGRNPNIIRSGRTSASTYAEMWRVLERGDIWQGELSNRRKNGEIYIESVRISPVRQPTGKITHYLAIKEDITEHKRVADAIRESKILLQRVIDSTPDWIFVKDKEQRFMLVNESFAQAFNQTPDTMIGRCDTDDENDQAVLSGQSIHKPYDKVVFKNGDVRVFDTFKGPLRDSSQKIYGILCYRRDITKRFNTEQEQHALELQLRQAQKMETIGHLTGGIAHDFNNILASILGYAELIQMSDDIQKNLPLNQYLQEILQAGIRAKELVAQLLTFSKKKEVAAESIAVAPILNEVGKLLRSTTPASISIKIEKGKGLPEVLISPIQLHQILLNLGINARDAIVGTGTVKIGAETLVLDDFKTCDSCHRHFSGKYLMISVRDSGTGISPENLLKIFDPFFTTKEVGRGTGLGLSVLHGIVHSANGHIEVLTALGEGTKFRIYLPARLRQTESLANDLDPAPENIRARGHVMVVDDDASIVRFITALLESLGCQVTDLTSAHEALRVFEDDPYGVDMVITDQTMPELSGAELASAMLALRPDIPIVMSTGYSNTINEDTARQIGIRRFLIKPVPAKVLADVVAECLAAKTLRD